MCSLYMQTKLWKRHSIRKVGARIKDSASFYKSTFILFETKLYQKLTAETPVWCNCEGEVPTTIVVGLKLWPVGSVFSTTIVLSLGAKTFNGHEKKKSIKSYVWVRVMWSVGRRHIRKVRREVLWFYSKRRYWVIISFFCNILRFCFLCATFK